MSTGQTEEMLKMRRSGGEVSMINYKREMSTRKLLLNRPLSAEFVHPLLPHPSFQLADKEELPTAAYQWPDIT